MDIAVFMMGGVALGAVAVSMVAVLTLAKAARERRHDIMRSEIVVRSAELATTPEQLPIAMAMPPDLDTTGAVDEPHAAVLSRAEKTKMIAGHLDPDDFDDVRVFRLMTESGYDPSDPDQVEAWNELGQA